MHSKCADIYLVCVGAQPRIAAWLLCREHSLHAQHHQHGVSTSRAPRLTGQPAGDTSLSPWCAASLLHAKSGCSPGRWLVLGTETGQQSALLVPFPWVLQPWVAAGELGEEIGWGGCGNALGRGLQVGLVIVLPLFVFAALGVAYHPLLSVSSHLNSGKLQ